MKTKYTDYNNCLVNVASSILKHFQIPWDKDTIPELDQVLQNKKKIVLMLLDGMGINIIKNNLEENAFLNTHIHKTINSVFPPTTVAATTSVLTGKYPIEHGWLGWHLYLSCKDPSLILFRNTDYYKNEPYEKLRVRNVIPTKTILEYIGEKEIETFTISPSFDPNGFKTFDEAISRCKDILDTFDESFTYFYWDHPDATIHQYGTKSNITNSLMHSFNDKIENFSKTIDSDTLIILLADHGLVDVEPIDFSRLKDLNKMLQKKMSGEGRASIFHVKKKELISFKERFLYYLGDYFDLYSRNEILENKIYGDSDNIHKSLKYSLGDYVAIAKGPYYLTTDFDFVFKGHHAGGLKEETDIPLILIKKEND